MLRVAYLNASGGLGGSEMALLSLLKGLRNLGIPLDVHVVLGEQGPFVQSLESVAARVHVLPYSSSLSKIGDSDRPGIQRYLKLVNGLAAAVSYSRRLRELLKVIRPDVVHSNSLKMNLLSAWIVEAPQLLIWHIHDYVGRRAISRHLLRLSVKSVRATISNSKHVNEDLKIAGIKGREMITIYNGIDTEKFSPRGNRIDLDALSGLPAAEPETVRVGLLGTFAKWKGHRVFLEAMALVAAQVPIRGYVIGAPIYQTDGSQFSIDELKSLCRTLGIAENIGFTGFVDEPAAAIRALDIVVHASTEPEPFGMVIAEALACGKAMVASRAGGAQEIFSEHVNVLAHTPGDAQELAECLLRLVNEPELRKRLGSQGARDVAQRFSLRQCASEVAGLYSRISERTLAAPESRAIPTDLVATAQQTVPECL